MSLEGILNTFTTAIFVYSLKEKQVVVLNDAAKKLFSESCDDLRLLFHQVDEAEYQKLIHTIETASEEKEEKVLLEWSHEDGKPAYLEVHVKHIEDGGEAFVVGHAYQVRHRHVQVMPTVTKYNIYDQVKLFDFLHQVVGLQRNPENINRILAHLGEQLGVSRVFIHEFLNDRNHCKCTFEWCREGIESQLENQSSLDLSRVEWIEVMLENGALAVSDIYEMDDLTVELLKVKGAKSVAGVPLFHSDIFYGFLAVDECERKRVWKQEEIHIMEAVGAIMTTMLYREKNLREDYNYEIFQTVMNNMKSLIYITDMKTHKILFANTMIKTLLDDEEVEGKKCYETFKHCTGPSSDFCPIGQLLDEDGRPNPPIKWEFFNPRLKRWFSITDSAIRWVDGSYVHMEQAMDITGIKENEMLLERYATTDIMTGLLKRDWGIRQLEALLVKSQMENKNLVIYFVDMDSLKHINDNYGHNMGDVAIKMVAKALKNNFRKSDIICRMGGDEFLVVVEDCQAEYADRIMQRVKKELDDFNNRNKHNFRVEISIGRIEVKGDAYRSADEVIRRADWEMYVDKKRNKRRLDRPRR